VFGSAQRVVPEGQAEDASRGGRGVETGGGLGREGGREGGRGQLVSAHKAKVSRPGGGREARRKG